MKSDNQHTLLIRCDGSYSVGYGHMFRCIALAEILKNHFIIHFIEKDSNEFALSQFKRITPHIIHLEDDSLQHEAHYISEFILNASSVFILDGYQYSSEYQREIKKSGATLVCIDDLHAIHFCADIIINQAFGVSQTTYSAESYTQFCLGFDWIIQRPEFIKSAKKQRIISSTSSIFFTLGGSPIFNIAPKIISVLDRISQVKRIVFLKGSNDVFEKDVRHNLEKSSKQIEIFENLDDKDLCTLMLTCDIAICPASVISLEVCSVGMGLFTGYTAINQIDNYRGIVTNELAFALGDLHEISEDSLRDIIEINLDLNAISIQVDHQKRIFDGQSEKRYVNLFKTL